MSLPHAERLVYSAITAACGLSSLRALREAAEGYLRGGTTIDEPSPGRIIIRPKGRRPAWLLEEAQRLLQEETPLGVCVTVEQAPTPEVGLDTAAEV